MPAKTTRVPNPLSAVRESAVLRAVLATLAAFGVPAFRMNSGAMKIGDRFFRAGFPGVADTIGVLPGPGRMIVCECKRPKGGRLTTDQRAFLETVRDAGGVALVISDVAVLAGVLTTLRSDPWARFELTGERAS